MKGHSILMASLFPDWYCDTQSNLLATSPPPSSKMNIPWQEA